MSCPSHLAGEMRLPNSFYISLAKDFFPLLTEMILLYQELFFLERRGLYKDWHLPLETKHVCVFLYRKYALFSTTHYKPTSKSDFKIQTREASTI
jgi:hypothetical protein